MSGDDLAESGRLGFFPSSTRVAGSYAIRPCYINPRTTVAEVDGLAEAVVAAGRTLTAAVTA